MGSICLWPNFNPSPAPTPERFLHFTIATHTPPRDFEGAPLNILCTGPRIPSDSPGQGYSASWPSATRCLTDWWCFRSKEENHLSIFKLLAKRQFFKKLCRVFGPIHLPFNLDRCLSLSKEIDAAAVLLWKINKIKIMFFALEDE